MNKRIGIVALLGALVIGIPGVLYNSRAADTADADTQPNSDSVPLQDDMAEARTKGSLDAPLTMFEFADFQCSACKILFDSTIPLLIEEYIDTGKLKLIFLNFPIGQIHPNAPVAHEFAMCAAQQERFWEVHDLLYRNQTSWAELDDPRDYFLVLADSAVLQRDSLDACLQSGAIAALIQSEFEAAYRAGIQSTPSLVLEGGLITGAIPMESLRPLLDSLYEARVQN
ncbi:MAG: DsbA family protein [Gemmatimonadales bacterium]